MPTFERVTLLPFETKSFDPATGVVTGLASTPQLDRMNEIVSADAMREAAERYMQNPIVTWQHNTSEPIGRGLRVEPGDGGTVLECYITDKTEAGRNCRGLLEDRIVRSMSIGFNPYSRSFGPHPDNMPDYEVTGDVLTWQRIDWLETAICAIPCNPGATIQLAKSLSLEMARPQEPSPDEAEEARFLSDLDRYCGSGEALANILRHWRKEQRTLTAEHRTRIAQAQAALADLLEPYPAAADPVAAPQGALSLPPLVPLALPGVVS